MAARKRNDRRSGSNAGTVFWLAAIVIVLFIFALNWGKIQDTLARTNFHEIVKTQSGTDAKPPQPSAPPAPQSAPARPAAQAPSPSAAAPPRADATPPASSGGATGQDQSASEGPSASEGSPASEGARLSKAVASAQSARTRSAPLFFVRIDDDGVIIRQEVKRQILVSDSPLLDSLDALLKGPSEDEIRKKLISLVPQGTKLLSAQVRGSTAFLNFNEAFMYNHYGIEGYAGQLKQVVYTATSFPTVQDVQILIEGEKHDYLGGEGVYIGRPLSRNSF
jgi:hypothetical protein